MGTSKSNKRAATWTAGAFLYSGRPDPTWTVDERTTLILEKLWATLPPWQGPTPLAPPLGYRGCFVRDVEAREWLAHRGIVTLKSDDKTESRQDTTKEFEKAILSSAPRDAYPEEVIRILNLDKR